MVERPFWQATYGALDAPDPFGLPGEELAAVVPALPPEATVLDLGCGEGRNALFLAEQGCRVTAVDISEAGIRKLQHRASKQGLIIRAEVEDLEGYAITGFYDLIVAHGVLHLLRPASRNVLLERMQAHTRPGGFNVAVAFTDALPPPQDLAPFTVGLFREGELFERYDGWRTVLRRSYILEDEHPGGVRHRHPINKLVAQRPGA